MNHRTINEQRKALENRDLLVVESWVREQGRQAIESWLSIPEQVRADVVSVLFALGLEKRQRPFGFPVIALQQERLKRSWSLKTAAEHIVKSGLPGMTAEQLHVLEVLPKRRSDSPLPVVHGLERVYEMSWESLITPLQGARLPEKSAEPTVAAVSPSAPRKNVAPSAPTVPAAETATSLPPVAA